MPRLREVPSEVARQALVHKTLNEDQVREAFEGDPIRADADELSIVATDVTVPELLPYEYAYVDVYATDDDRFLIDINETEYRRSSSKTLQPSR